MISVIIPSFNRAPFLKKAVESILSQTYKDFEIIIIDDGSWDNTRDIVSYFSNRIKYIKQDNKGPGAARNLGIKNSRGDFIAFLDSDDCWEQEKLGLQINEMRQNPTYLISHTEEVWYRDGVHLNQKKKHKKFDGYIFERCLPLCVVSMSTVMVKRELFSKVGLFDETLPCCEDYDFWLRSSIKHPFLLIDKALTLKDGGRRDQVSYIYKTGIDRFRIHSIVNVLESGTLSDGQEGLAIEELQKKCRIYGNGCLKHAKIEEAKYCLELTEKFKNPSGK